MDVNRVQTGQMSGPPVTSRVKIFCQECKGEISRDAQVCPHCHAPIVRRYCPRCARLVPETTAICPFCKAAANASPANIGRMSKIILIALGGAALFLLIKHGNWEISPEKTAGRIELGEQKPDTPPTRVPLKQANLEPQQQTAQPVITNNPQEGRRLNLEAHSLMKQGRYKEAIPILEKSIKAFEGAQSDEGYRYALFNMGRSLRVTGKAKEALPVLEQAIKIEPQHPLFISELQAARMAAGATPQ